MRNKLSIFVGLFVLLFVGCYGVSEKSSTRFEGSNITIIKQYGCVWEIRETDSSMRMDRVEIDKIIRSYGLSSMFWNTPYSLKVKCNNKAQLLAVGSAIDKWYATGFYTLEKKVIPDLKPGNEYDCEYIKKSDLSKEQMVAIIMNPPRRSVGWMDIHEGPWTNGCTLVDVSTGWADNRKLNEVTSQTSCDVPGHYGETSHFRKLN